MAKTKTDTVTATPKTLSQVLRDYKATEMARHEAVVDDMIARELRSFKWDVSNAPLPKTTAVVLPKPVAKRGRPRKVVKATVMPTAAPATRVRRTTESLKADAEKVLDFMVDHPKSSAKAIGEATKVDFGQSLPKFIQRHVGVSIVQDGAKRAAVYSVKATAPQPVPSDAEPQAAVAA